VAPHMHQGGLSSPITTAAEAVQALIEAIQPRLLKAARLSKHSTNKVGLPDVLIVMSQREPY